MLTNQKIYGKLIKLLRICSKMIIRAYAFHIYIIGRKRLPSY